MSAYVVPHDHIDVLAFNSGAMSHERYFWNGDWHKLTSWQEVGEILLAENVRSVNYRYSEQVEDEPYRFVLPHRRYTPVEIIRACDGYMSQASHSPDWRETQAYAIVKRIRERAIRKLDGYDAAQWEINDNKNRWRKEAR
jgi:hypothetical protein